MILGLLNSTSTKRKKQRCSGDGELGFQMPLNSRRGSGSAAVRAGPAAHALPVAATPTPTPSASTAERGPGVQTKELSDGVLTAAAGVQ